MAAATRIKHILVVGGGTAGWLSACHLARHLQCQQPGSVQVTLLESADIPTIGVGEGTVPAIRQSLQHLGISETDFIRECDATFKQGIKFVGWRKANGGQRHHYYHPFDYPEQQPIALTPYYLLKPGPDNYVNRLTIQGQVCDAGLAPKTISPPEYDGLCNYAYHLDAARFAAFLTRHATEKLGVNHIKANVSAVRQNADGSIASVMTDSVGEVSADFFVDCTGFRSLLLGDTLQVPFISKNDILLADNAVALQMPYATADSPIASYTIASAQNAGWIWDIGLSKRRGTGYVYSSQFADAETAEQTLRQYLGPAAAELPCRHIPMQVGYRQSFWQKNCVAIGLSQGFVEPLEATGLLVYDAAARYLAEILPLDTRLLAAAAAEFDQHVHYAWDRVIDFIKLHYLLSDLDDIGFWHANRLPETVPASLQTKLERWQQQLPSQYDFASRFEIFNLDNYLYVLYGMDFYTDLTLRQSCYPHGAAAERYFGQIRQQASQAVRQLPAHRQLLAQIQQYRLQTI
ncbi:tryptophan halogenase family protein [Arsukibacterium perlucidum]|uniref:tryptophan halogenase family protein n=1 Tax=Arsukibacterium perlucidum TaxID=368811 RepID=UPI00035F2A91|nr:tryptophan halogenase family protein [Arsukibacterium perlucidum]